MGVWSVPVTESAVAELERLMARPIPASGACASLDPLVGDDTLFELVEKVAARDGNADVRPLVAMTLDEWVNWSPRESFGAKAAGARPAVEWTEALRDRCRALVEPFRGADVSALAPRALVVANADAAVRQVALCVKGGMASGAVAEGRFDVEAGPGPGTYAVRDGSTGEVYRVEAIHGVVSEAGDAIRERISAEVFEAQSSLAP